MTALTDTLARPLRDLRISVTDRCNFRCTYCMPKEVFGRDFVFLRREQLLTFEEIDAAGPAVPGRRRRPRSASPAANRCCAATSRRWSRCSPRCDLDGLADLTLTTNGALLPAKARVLRDAGLDRVTVSLDSLDDDVFQSHERRPLPASHVCSTGIDAAQRPGSPVKVNMVVKRGVNDRSRHGHGRALPRHRHHPALHRVHGRRHHQRLAPGRRRARRRSWSTSCRPSAGRSSRSRHATRARSPTAYRYLDGAGEIGVIASVTRPFCGDCTRARLSAEGELYTCLFAAHGRDLRSPLREGATDEQLAALLGRIWGNRGDRYSELRSAETGDGPRVEMSHIGG